MKLDAVVVGFSPRDLCFERVELEKPRLILSRQVVETLEFCSNEMAGLSSSDLNSQFLGIRGERWRCPLFRENSPARHVIART